MGRLQRRGYTIIEVVIATAILSFGIVGVLAAVSMSLRAHGNAMRLERAVEIAQRELALAVAKPKEAYASTRGTEDALRWTVSYEPRDLDLVLAQVRVAWSDQGQPRQLSVEELFRPPAAKDAEADP